MAVSSRRARLARPLIVVAVLAVLAVLVGLFYASPYIALNRLKKAADARDAATVNRYVDFPALQTSLKQQAAALLTREIDRHGGPNGSPLAALGAMIGGALIGPVVDAYATPEGVAAMLDGIPPDLAPGRHPPAAPSPAPAAGEAPADGQSAPAAPPAVASSGAPPSSGAQTTAGYRGVNEFVVSYRHGVGDGRYAAVLRREGLFTWKLAAVELDPDAQGAP